MSWFGLCHFVFSNHSWHSIREISEYERARFFCLRFPIALRLVMRIVCMKLSRARRYFVSRTYILHAVNINRQSTFVIIHTDVYTIFFMGIFRWSFLGYNLCSRAYSGHAYVFNHTNTDRIKLTNDF